MKCPRCGENNSTVKDTRQRGAVRWRRYQCRSCRTYYETIELVTDRPNQYIDRKERYKQI